MKKAVSMSVATVLISSLLLSACSDNKEATKPDNKAATDNINSAGIFPIVKEKVTLKVLMSGSPRVEDYNTNEFTKWLEEKTNVHVDWEVVPAAQADQKLNLMLASGTYPDIILGFAVTPTKQLIYGSQGIFKPLNELIDKYGPETKKVLADMPEVKKAITAADGKVYSLPNINACYHCSMSYKMWLNAKWMEKLNLPYPTNTEEFYQVLKAFKERDPNGNGKADEIPLAGSITGNGGNIEYYLMNAFIDDNPYNDNNRLMVNNGKVDVAFNKPEWKEGLKYFNRLYKEGLLAPESFTQDEKQFRQLANGTDAMRLGAGAGAGPGRFTTIYGQDGRWLDYISIPPLKGPNGLKQAAYNPYPFTSAAPGNFIITSTNKYPEISMRWADLLYSKEGIGSAEGREGKEFTWLNGQDSSKIGMNGKPALWARIKSFNPNDVQNIDWQQGAISVRNRTFWDGENADPEKPDQTLYYRETAKNYEPYKQDIKKIVPLLYYTDQQANEIADLKKTINDYVNEMFIRFATGDQDIDKNWDSYLKNLDNMNLKRYLQIMQEAYEPTKK